MSQVKFVFVDPKNKLLKSLKAIRYERYGGFKIESN